MNFLILAMALAAAPAVPAAQEGAPAPAELPSAFYDCDISTGQAIRCGSTYQGKAVVLVGKLIQECSIADGQPTECDGPYHGFAVVKHEGIYKSCDVADGQIARCTAWHEGKAAVWKGKGSPKAPKAVKKDDDPAKKAEPARAKTKARILPIKKGK